MKILFVSNSTIRFNVETPLKEPLGGTESAMAYLASHLAAMDHEVALISYLPEGTPDRLRGVRHIDLAQVSNETVAQGRFDVIVGANTKSVVAAKTISPSSVNIAWLHRMPDQPDMATIRQDAPAIDCAVFVSETQRAIIGFPTRSVVIGNGISPAFEAMFSSADDLRAAKQNRAAYTSTPFRGLNLLPAVIGHARVETEFEIYSGMRLYQTEETGFEPLYQALTDTPRCRNHGPVSQTELARRLRSIAFLTYPCVFPETYGIAVVEAIAAGLKVISTDFGALKESTLGFADLLPFNPSIPLGEVIAPFIALVEANVARFNADPRAWAEQRFEQLQTVNRLCTWKARAEEWDRLLRGIMVARGFGR